MNLDKALILSGSLFFSEREEGEEGFDDLRSNFYL